MKNDAITSREDDFAKWYTDVVMASKLCDYSCVKGCMVLEPNGYALWEKIQSVLDREFKKLGHKNVSMPLFIPESLLKKEGEHIKGFAPEVAWVTHGGINELEEKICVRPTSETLFCDYYSRKVKSYRDLPKLYNQWCSVVRWEKETRPFLRTREFLWQEGHTIHSTSEEAEQETLTMLNVYKKFFEEYLAIPVITGRKTEKEKFAGAEYTYTLEALMYNGVSLQCGTSHYFGQKFSKPFDVKFLNKDNNLEYVYQTSWGVSTRMIGGLIMVHSDNAGLVLPPKIAPMQVGIIPIGRSDEVKFLSDDISKKLDENGITNYIDITDKSVGYKFSESETNGIPFRIEVGERDLSNGEITITRRDTLEKTKVSKDVDIVKCINELIETMQKDMYNRALNKRNEMTYTCTNLDEIRKIINTKPGFIKAMWCGNEECELKMKEIGGIKSRCIPFDQEHVGEKCVVCGQESKEMVIWGIQY